MFLHIGQEKVIPMKDIVAILDVKCESYSIYTQEFLATAAEEGFVQTLIEKPKSFVVTTDRVYLSPISAATLNKRVSEFLNLTNSK